MTNRIRIIRQFFFSQQFIDGLRTTLAILLPALISSYYGRLDLGFTFSLGAMSVGITDAPGPIKHRQNGMRACILCLLLVSVITLLVQHTPYLLGLEIILFSFFFSMFSIYNARAGAVGTASILVMILSMDKISPQSEIGQYALLITGGGIWYMLISLLAYYIRPYRPAQRALGNCIIEISRYLTIKADFYNVSTNLNDDYQKMIRQQIVVNEQLEVVREMFFKTGQILNARSTTAKKLILTFDETVDLSEDITAIYYDYTTLREQYKDTVILNSFAVVIRNTAYELEKIGLAIQSNIPYSSKMDFDQQIKVLKEEIDEIVKKDQQEGTLVLRKIMVNVRKIMQRVRAINRYFDNTDFTLNRKLDYSRFVSHQPIDIRLFWNNLNFDSLIFKHSIRVAVACIIGFVIAKSLAYGQHTYWILLTIAFIIKPAFGLTRQRNIERITGTLLGGFTGVLILFFIKSTTLQFALLVFFMLGAYSFLRTHYFAMVYCVTTYVILLFKFLGFPFVSVVQERVLDTLIGCAVAFSASYFLFPTWEADQLRTAIKDVLKANAAYLQKLVEGLLGHSISTLDYKLARKEIYIQSANLSAAIQRMLSEPKNKQKHRKDVEQFTLQNHILFSNIATLISSVIHQSGKQYPEETMQLAIKAFYRLHDTVQKLDEHHAAPHLEPAKIVAAEPYEDAHFNDQLRFVYKTIKDISKTTDAILST